MPCVTASVNGVELLRPIEVGEHVSMAARVSYTTARSLGVPGALEQSLHGYFTYRPLDRRAGVPELELGSDSERSLCLEASHHLALQRRLSDQ